MVGMFSVRSPFVRRSDELRTKNAREYEVPRRRRIRERKDFRQFEDGSMKLYVGNLPYNISDDQLQAMFAKFGTPDSARVITDRDTGQSKGFGFVEYSNQDQAKEALSLNGTEFGGRSLRVNEARPKNESVGGRSRY
jgi:cold-inducible RNA-binding protein